MDRIDLIYSYPKIIKIDQALIPVSLRDLRLIDVAIIIFDDVDLLDVTGPKEVFSAASIQGDPADVDITDRFSAMYNTISLFNTLLVSIEEKDFITSADGTKIIPDLAIKDLEGSNANFKPFIYVIPGGKGIHKVRKDERFISFLQKYIPEAHLSLSVCTGAYGLASAGLLDTEELVTTHWRHYETFMDEFPQLKVANNARYVDNGTNIITAGGVSSGIDGALRVVARLVSDEVAQRVADRLVYPWLD